MCTRYDFVAPETFNVILDNYLERRSEKRKAKAFITREMYDLAIKILLNPNDVGLADKQHRHWVRTTFELRKDASDDTDQDDYVLYKKSKGPNSRPARPVCPKERLYEVLTEMHDQLQHPGMTVFWNAIASKYACITQELVEIFISNCSVCNFYKNKGRLSMKTILPSKFLTRVQFDIMQVTLANEDFQYICHARDDFTNWLWTSPLKTKSTQEVVNALFNMFTVFGAPLILQSTSDKKFTADVIQLLKKKLPQSKIIHGKLLPRSYENMEKINNSLQRKLAEWMESNEDGWNTGLPIVTYEINTSVSCVTGATPYELVFGQAPVANLNLLSELEDEGVCDEETMRLKIEEMPYSNSECAYNDETINHVGNVEPSDRENARSANATEVITGQEREQQGINIENNNNNNNQGYNNAKKGKKNSRPQCVKCNKPISIKEFWKQAECITEEDWESVKELLSSTEELLVVEKSAKKLKKHLTILLKNLLRFEQNNKFPQNEVREWNKKIGAWLRVVSERAGSSFEQPAIESITKNSTEARVKRQKRSNVAKYLNTKKPRLD